MEKMSIICEIVRLLNQVTKVSVGRKYGASSIYIIYFGQKNKWMKITYDCYSLDY